MPDILFVAHRVPYPRHPGDNNRQFHLVNSLAGYAQIHLAALANEPPTPEAVDVLQALCARVCIVPLKWSRRIHGLSSFASGGSASRGVMQSRHLDTLIRTWTKGTRFAAAIASASSVAHYLKHSGLRQARRVVDLVDLGGRKWSDYAAGAGPPKSWLYSLEGRQLGRIERNICRWASAVTLASEADAVTMSEATGATNIYAVTGGVDFEYFAPLPAARESGCVFVADLDYFPNIDAIGWFSRAVWPNVRQWRPEARLSIVGRKPARSVLELRAIPGIDVIGEVPDVRPYLARAAVVVAPARTAAGLPNNVLEAMASGKPVVASRSALSAMGDRPDLPVRAVNDASEWVAVISSLLGDAAERRRLGEAGRYYVRLHHHWGNCLTPFRELLELHAPLAIATRH